MIAPETLLKMHPIDALRAQMGELLKPPLKAKHLKIENPISLGGVRTSVLVTLDKSKAPIDLWDRAGTFTFEYDRIDLAAFTADLPMRVKAQLPVTPQSLLTNVLYPFRIPVVATDLVDAQYTSLGNVSLLAAEESYRWVGEVGCLIEQLGIDIPNLILVSTFTFSFSPEFRSADIKNRLSVQLNLSNASALPVPVNTSMFTISDPVEAAPSDYGDNTSIIMTFNGAPYVGAVEVRYGRRSFQKTFRWPVKLSGTRPTNMTGLAARLSTALGCVIATTDIQSEPFPSVQVGQTLKFPVTFRSSSLAYVGSVLVDFTAG